MILPCPAVTRLGLGPMLGRKGVEALPPSLAAVGPGHPPAQQRMQVERQERGFMGPVFEQPSLPPASPGRRIDQGRVIGSEAREGGQVVDAE